MYITLLFILTAAIVLFALFVGDWRSKPHSKNLDYSTVEYYERWAQQHIDIYERSCAIYDKPSCDHANFLHQDICPGCGLTHRQVTEDHIDMLESRGSTDAADWWRGILETER